MTKRRRTTNKPESEAEGQQSEKKTRTTTQPQQRNTAQQHISPTASSLDTVESVDIYDPRFSAHENRTNESNEPIGGRFILMSRPNARHRPPTPSPSAVAEEDDTDIDDELSALFPDLLFRNQRTTSALQDDNAFCTEIVDQLKNSTNELVQEIRESRTQFKQDMEESSKQIVHSINQFRSDLRKVLLQELPAKLNANKK